MKCKEVSNKTFKGVKGETRDRVYHRIQNAINPLIEARLTLPTGVIRGIKWYFGGNDDSDELPEEIIWRDEIQFFIEEVWVVPGLAMVWRAMAYECFTTDRANYEIDGLNEEVWEGRELDQIVAMGFTNGMYRICTYLGNPGDPF